MVFRANDTRLTVGADGKATLTLPGDADTVTITALIPISITGAAVTPAGTEYTCDGSPKTPAVTVVLNGQTLNPETDYTVSYPDNTLA